jgi:hypothetical protein
MSVDVFPVLSEEDTFALTHGFRLNNKSWFFEFSVGLSNDNNLLINQNHFIFIILLVGTLVDFFTFIAIAFL